MPGLFATWFGAGTLLTATDEVAHGGLQLIALEPLGSGLCLIIAGVAFAQKLWDMKLLTVIDFYRLRFGPRAEVVSGVLMVPGYLGWIAAQFIALSELLHLFFGIPVAVGIAAVAVVGALYTLIGGMWSVTLTDAIQVTILVLGIFVLAVSVLWTLGEGNPASGAATLWANIPAEKRTIVPTAHAGEAVGWITLLAVAALGNIPAQDLTQRIFASKSATVAKRACITAGVLYVLVGLIPVLLGLGLLPLLDTRDGSVLAAVASAFLHPLPLILFILAICSAVLSTIDSAMLSPSSVIAQNIVPHLWRSQSNTTNRLALNRWMVLVVTGFSLVLAYSGASAFELLETAYAIGLVALLVPLAGGLYSKAGDERTALWSMGVATVVWGTHLALGMEDFLGLTPVLPATLASTLIGLAIYTVGARISKSESSINIIIRCCCCFLLSHYSPSFGPSGGSTHIFHRRISRRRRNPNLGGTNLLRHLTIHIFPGIVMVGGVTTFRRPLYNV
ncbi:MAG: hypothetical protein AAF658_16895, partial [Myxococcota bacterium]